MTRHWLVLAVLFIFSLCLLGCNGSKKNKIKLKDLDVITLRHGHWTTGRRTRPIPQLACIGGTNRCKFLPQVVQCYNRGFNGQDVQWECKADLNKNLRFNKIDVTCEGYDYPEDDFVLVGSCGLEYSIDTIDGTVPFPEPHFNKPHPNSLPKRPHKKDEPGFMTVFVLAIIAAFMYLIYKNCIEPLDPEARRRRRSSPSPSAPPPPPGFIPPEFTTRDDSPNYPSFASSSSQQTSNANSTASDSGFWSGFTWGGMAGYLLASATSNTQGVPPPPQANQGETSSTSSSSWSSWSFWPRSDVRQRHRREESHFSRESSSEPSDSSSARTASGYGGTNRR